MHNSEEDNSRSCACKVFIEIPDREIDMEVANSMRSNSVNPETQVSDEMFQPVSAVKYAYSHLIIFDDPLALQCLLTASSHDQPISRDIFDYLCERYRATSLRRFPTDQFGLEFPFDPGSRFLTTYLGGTRKYICCDMLMASTLWNRLIRIRGTLLTGSLVFFIKSVAIVSACIFQAIFHGSDGMGIDKLGQQLSAMEVHPYPANGLCDALYSVSTIWCSVKEADAKGTLFFVSSDHIQLSEVLLLCRIGFFVAENAMLGMARNLRGLLCIFPDEDMQLVAQYHMSNAKLPITVILDSPELLVEHEVFEPLWEGSYILIKDGIRLMHHIKFLHGRPTGESSKASFVEFIITLLAALLYGVTQAFDKVLRVNRQGNFIYPSGVLCYVEKRMNVVDMSLRFHPSMLTPLALKSLKLDLLAYEDTKFQNVTFTKIVAIIELVAHMFEVLVNAFAVIELGKNLFVIWSFDAEQSLIDIVDGLVVAATSTLGYILFLGHCEHFGMATICSDYATSTIWDSNLEDKVGPECRKLIKEKVLDISMNCILDLENQRKPEECEALFLQPRKCPDMESLSKVPCNIDDFSSGRRAHRHLCARARSTTYAAINKPHL
ncbi:hypothetical protein A4A49_35009 [Nicotiana attenuata]|uniref:Uncharacterized protein n=1 Tax=Nicotiana attenuata TaxID=49451 RepID=A0A314L4P3_NICAT|nr:hypothetical protein A4A49_35009 [Nicotiana attenuata]